MAEPIEEMQTGRHALSPSDDAIRELLAVVGHDRGKGKEGKSAVFSARPLERVHNRQQVTQREAQGRTQDRYNGPLASVSVVCRRCGVR